MLLPQRPKRDRELSTVNDHIYTSCVKRAFRVHGASNVRLEYMSAIVFMYVIAWCMKRAFGVHGALNVRLEYMSKVARISMIWTLLLHPFFP